MMFRVLVSGVWFGLSDFGCLIVVGVCAGGRSAERLRTISGRFNSRRIEKHGPKKTVMPEYRYRHPVQRMDSRQLHAGMTDLITEHGHARMFLAGMTDWLTCIPAN